MIKKLRSSFALAVSTISLVTLFSGQIVLPVHAQSQADDQVARSYGGVLISAPGYEDLTFEFKGAPGDTLTGSFIAKHDFDDPELEKRLYIYASDFDIDPQTNVRDYPKNLRGEKSQFSLYDWITFDKEYIDLNEKGQEEIVNFVANIPDDAAPGSHYGILLLSDITKEEFMQQKFEGEDDILGAGVAGRIGPNIIITVDGDINADAEILDFYPQSVDSYNLLFGFLADFPPVRAVTRIKNNGNVFIKPFGTIFIHRGDINNPEAVIEFNKDGSRVLPESERVFSEKWDDGAFRYIEKTDPVTGDTSTELKTDFSTILSDLKIGMYQATLEANYTDQDGTSYPLTANFSFLVFPWQAFLLVVLSIAIIIAYKKLTKQSKEKK